MFKVSKIRAHQEEGKDSKCVKMNDMHFKMSVMSFLHKQNVFVAKGHNVNVIKLIKFISGSFY